MLSWRVVVPFLLTGTIWGSTWFVITGQIDGVPAAWSVFYRFALATPALFFVAVLMQRRLRLTGPEQRQPIGEGEGLFLAVGDEDGADALSLEQIPNFADQTHSHLGVDIGERLVEQH